MSFCSVNQCSGGLNCVKTGLLIERHSDRKVIAVSQRLNFKSRDNLSALEPSDQGPMYVRKCRVLPFYSASAKSKSSIVVVNEDIMNSCFHPPGLCRGTDKSRCLRKSSLATCSSEQYFSVIRAKDVSSTRVPVSQRNSVSWNENNISQPASRIENKVSHSLSRNENIDVCSVWSQYGDSYVFVVSRVADHHSLLPATCETCTCLLQSYSGLFYDSASIGQCTGVFMEVPESLCQFIENSPNRRVSSGSRTIESLLVGQLPVIVRRSHQL